jgi:hypothetical protein
VFALSAGGLSPHGVIIPRDAAAIHHAAFSLRIITSHSHPATALEDALRAGLA